MSKSFHLSTKFKEKFKERIYKRGDNDYCKGISTLVGAGILNFLVGAIFSLCTLSVYEISYIKAKGGSISIDHLTFYYPIEIIFQYISAFFSGKIYDDLGLHTTNLIGTTILTLGYFIMYISSNLLMDLSSMIVGGIGTGIILYPSTTNAIEWFTQHNGIIMGIMETMISFGSFFFAFIGEIIINKEKIPSHSDDNLYDYKIGKKIKLYLIIQILALDCAFLISYGLMFEKEEEEENFLKDLENETQVIRFETVTDINEHIEKNDEHFDDNIKINEKKMRGIMIGTTKIVKRFLSI
jgi:MFS family permease